MKRRGNGARTAVGAALLAAMTALGGCGSQDAAPRTPAGDTTGLDTTGLDTPGIDTPGGEAATKLISVPWRLAGVDGVLLEITVAGAGCVSFQNLDVTETAKRVTIAAQAVKDVTPGTFCSQEIVTESAPTALERPLGKRELVHAPLSAEWAGPKTLGPDRRALPR